MYNFSFDIPTKIHFGKGQISHLSECKESGTKVLIVYGGGSVVRSGLLDKAIDIFNENEMTVFELGGVEPNPKIQLVRQGVNICKDEGIEMVLAIGGGSCIDSAKLIAAGVYYDGDPWDLMMDSSKIKKALPIYSILTLAATGSEMDDSTVISDDTINVKCDISNRHLLPTMSILDPENTYTVPANQTAAGAADIMSHVFECYFVKGNGARLQQHIMEGILKTVIEYAPIAIKEPDNYEARANLMWCSTLALNNLTIYGSSDVAWCVHPIEYEITAYYGTTHGVGLAILTPAWMRYVLSEETAKRFADYGRSVWNLSLEDDDMTVAKTAIDKTEKFFESIGIPTRLSQLGITDENFDKMAERASKYTKDCYKELDAKDIYNIFKNAL